MNIAPVYKGGKPRIDREAVIRLKQEGRGPTEIAREMGISRMHVHRVLRGDTGRQTGSRDAAARSK
jgi:DNA invertase Pin-like site-specific DNA recombinase